MKFTTYLKAKIIFTVLFILISSFAIAAEPLAYWDFNEGSGNTAKDVAGGKFPGDIHNAQYIKKTKGGYSLKFNGVDSWVDCGNVPAFNLKNNYTLLGWIKPQSQEGERGLFGQYMNGGYAVTIYRGGVWAYSGKEQSFYGQSVKINEWNFVALIYTGKDVILYVNGREAGRMEAKSPENDKFTNFRIGAVSPVAVLNLNDYKPFNGEIDEVKFFKTVLTAKEIADEYNNAASEFNMPRVETNAAPLTSEVFTYNKSAALSVNYANVPNRSKEDKVTLTLIQEKKTIKTQSFATSDPRYEAELEAEIVSGANKRYTWKAEYEQSGKITQKLEIPYTFNPAGKALPSVSKFKATNPLKWVCPTPHFNYNVTANGGIELKIAKSTYQVASNYSIPNSLDKNYFSIKGQPNWTVKVSKSGNGSYKVTGENAYYMVERTITKDKTRIMIKDKITNKTSDLLGVIFSNYFDNVDPNYTVMADSTPTIWLSDNKNAAGIFAMDDVYMSQLEKRNYKGKLEMYSTHFGLEPKANYTIEWSVYPMASPKYLDFINTVRNDEFKPVTIAGAFGFVDQREPIEKVLTYEQARFKNLKYACVYYSQNAKDDGISDLDGFEITNYPKETQFLHDTFTALKAQHPEIQFQIHIAYTIFNSEKPFSTGNPDVFADSKALDQNGNQYIYGPDSYDFYKSYIPKEWFDKGWRFYIYYTANNNSFSKFVLEKGMPHMLDKVGVNAYYSDGCVSGYVPGGYMYNFFDGNSVEIDPGTQTAKRRLGNSILVGLANLKEQYRMMNERGGVVFTSDVTPPRSFWNQRYVACCETDGGDQQPISALYLSPGFSPLGSRTMQANSRDIYRDMYNKLSISAPYSFYGDRDMLNYETIVMDMYPLTIEAISKGTIFGKERILTTQSGTYNFPNRKELHNVKTFDARGRRSLRRSVTTITNGMPVTKVDLGFGESAAIIPARIYVNSIKPVNAYIKSHNAQGIELEFNGSTKIDLLVKNCAFPIVDGQSYKVNGTSITAKNGQIKTSIKLNGLTKVKITK